MATKKPKGDPEKVGGNDDDGGEENSGKITSIHRAVEIEWEGTDGAEFVLKAKRPRKLGDGRIARWQWRDDIRFYVSGHTQFWRLQSE